MKIKSTITMTMQFRKRLLNVAIHAIQQHESAKNLFAHDPAYRQLQCDYFAAQYADAIAQLAAEGMKEDPRAFGQMEVNECGRMTVVDLAENFYR